MYWYPDYSVRCKCLLLLYGGIRWSQRTVGFRNWSLTRFEGMVREQLTFSRNSRICRHFQGERHIHRIYISFAGCDIFFEILRRSGCIFKKIDRWSHNSTSPNTYKPHYKAFQSIQQVFFERRSDHGKVAQKRFWNFVQLFLSFYVQNESYVSLYNIEG